MERIVRPATPSDREPILAVASAAFVTEPVFDYFFDDAYVPHAIEFFGYLLDIRLAGGMTWVEEVDGRVVAASLWDPPGGLRVDPIWRAARWQESAATFGADIVARLESYDALIHGLGPVGHHYYLGVIASDPTARGRGHGAAVLRPGLEAADATGLPTFLETGTQSNLDFYARYGFAVSNIADLSDGTRVWCLTRPPQGADPASVG